MHPSASTVTVMAPARSAASPPSSFTTDGRSAAGLPFTNAIGISDSSAAGPPCTSAGRDSAPACMRILKRSAFLSSGSTRF